VPLGRTVLQYGMGTQPWRSGRATTAALRIRTRIRTTWSIYEPLPVAALAPSGTLVCSKSAKPVPCLEEKKSHRHFTASADKGRCLPVAAVRRTHAARMNAAPP